MISYQQLDSFLKETFQFHRYQDAGLNGLQVGEKNKELKTISFAVDSNMSTLKKAIDLKSDLLLVHHGLFWGKSFSITDSIFQQIKLLMDHNLSLYAIHLPLDAHSVLGNNIQLANALKLKSITGAFFYKGENIGVQGVSPPIEDLLVSLKEAFPLYDQKEMGFLSSFIPTHKKSLRVGIITGQLSEEFLKEAILNYDLLITGEINLPLYNMALDSQFPLIKLGHHYSETLGVQALQKTLAKKYDKLNSFFIEDFKPI